MQGFLPDEPWLSERILALKGSLKAEDWLWLSISAGTELEAGLDVVLPFASLLSRLGLKTSFWPSECVIIP